MERDLLTVQEVSAYLKLSTITVYKYIRGQQLEAVAFGGHYRISRRALEQFIEQHKVFDGRGKTV